MMSITRQLGKKEYVIMNDREKLSGQSNRWNIGAGGDLPIGFGLSLAANEKSMAAFAEMNDEQKQAVVDKSRTMQTRGGYGTVCEQFGKRYFIIMA